MFSKLGAIQALMPSVGFNGAWQYYAKARLAVSTLSRLSCNLRVLELRAGFNGGFQRYA